MSRREKPGNKKKGRNKKKILAGGKKGGKGDGTKKKEEKEWKRRQFSLKTVFKREEGNLRRERGNPAAQDREEGVFGPMENGAGGGGPL